jgi:hypothetical protein
MLTYVGIGSCPHAATVAELTDEWDQLIPVFVRDAMARGVRVRLIHYDPQFAYRQEFLAEYFTARGFRHSGEAEGDGEWVSGKASITLLDREIHHPDDDGILAELAEEAIQTKGKLIVQEFTGHELTETLNALYAKTSSRSSFKRNVLIDMTYGTDCNCMTDMVKYKPLYMENGEFINMLLYDESEMLSHIGKSDKINALIKIYIVKKYLETVNLQVDYRRRRMGGTVIFPCDAYGNSSTPDEIMAYLQRKLRPILNVLDTLGLMNDQKWSDINKLFTDYEHVDMYKWNTKMREMVS